MPESRLSSDSETPTRRSGSLTSTSRWDWIAVGALQWIFSSALIDACCTVLSSAAHPRAVDRLLKEAWQAQFFFLPWLFSCFCYLFFFMPLFALYPRCITGEPRCCEHATIDSRTPGERRQHSAVGGVATCDINAWSCIRCSYEQHYSISIAKWIVLFPSPSPSPILYTARSLVTNSIASIWNTVSCYRYPVLHWHC